MRQRVYRPVFGLRIAGALHFWPARVFAPQRVTVERSPPGFPCSSLPRLLDGVFTSPSPLASPVFGTVGTQKTALHARMAVAVPTPRSLAIARQLSPALRR